MIESPTSPWWPPAALRRGQIRLAKMAVRGDSPPDSLLPFDLDHPAGAGQSEDGDTNLHRRGWTWSAMNAPHAALQIGFALDRRYHWLRGDKASTKEPALLALASVLNQHQVRWTLIDGIAAQVHLQEPRTTLDIDVALEHYADLPVAALSAAGFRHQGTFAHSDNWVGPGAAPVQFSAGPQWLGAIDRSGSVVLGDATLHILATADLLLAKMAAARDPARRRSKRLRDVADALALVEQSPDLRQTLTAEDLVWLDGL